MRIPDTVNYSISILKSILQVVQITFLRYLITPCLITVSHCKLNIPWYCKGRICVQYDFLSVRKWLMVDQLRTQVTVSNIRYCKKTFRLYIIYKGLISYKDPNQSFICPVQTLHGFLNRSRCLYFFFCFLLGLRLHLRSTSTVNF